MSGLQFYLAILLINRLSSLSAQMAESSEKPQKKHSKNTIFISNSAFSSTNSKSKIQKTIHSQTYHSQPKFENKRLKFFRITNASFFSHINTTKAVEAEQLLDQSFVKFLDNVQKHKGFKGTKTQSWNQLVYLTPQRRQKSSTQHLKQIKKQLYQIIKPEKQPQKPEKQEKFPVRTTLVQFLTEFSLKTEQNSSPTEKIHIKRCQRKGSNIIRQKLKNYQKKSEYQNKLNNYKMLFKGYKLPVS